MSEHVYKVLTPDGVYADGEWATLEAIPAKLPDRSEHYFDTAEADKILVPVVPPAVLPEQPRAHVFVPAGRFARADASWRYCNICGLVERADGTNKPCSGQFPPLSLRDDSKVPAPDAAFDARQAAETCANDWDAWDGISGADLVEWAFQRGAEWQAQRQSAPVDMLLFCPHCGEQHIDAARPNICQECGAHKVSCGCPAFVAWMNPPHKSHRCEMCNHVWRPADIPTNGVMQIKTAGSNDGNTRPRYYYTAKDFEDAVSAAQSAQRAALGGLVDEMRAIGTIEQPYTYALVVSWAERLRALLEGKPA